MFLSPKMLANVIAIRLTREKLMNDSCYLGGIFFYFLFSYFAHYLLQIHVQLCIHANFPTQFFIVLILFASEPFNSFSQKTGESKGKG